MPNSQHFDGLEEDKITWYSNTGFSNYSTTKLLAASGLEKNRITGFSNIQKEPQRCKEAKLHGTQTTG